MKYLSSENVKKVCTHKTNLYEGERCHYCNKLIPAFDNCWWVTERKKDLIICCDECFEKEQKNELETR